jgi:hypothetical protein
MPYGLQRGLGGLTPAQLTACNAEFMGGIFDPSCWQTINPPSTVAPVGSPTGSTLTVPPASGTDAQSTVDTLVNQQLVDQNALNAGAVTSSWWDTLTGDAYATTSGGLTSYLPWILGGVGLLIFGMAAMGGGSARRYGR